MLVIRGHGGPSSPCIDGGAGRLWTFVGSRHCLSIVVVCLMASHQWLWWAPIVFCGGVRREW